jgi:catechol 2,3-dioxygenase-like lactoylglutathione lyase family enzyme
VFTYICLGTSNVERSTRFYDACLGALGILRCHPDGEDFEGWAGWGTYRNSGLEELALWLCPPFDGGEARPGNGTMVAFSAASWQQVDAFHAAALSHGGSSEGAPGLRPEYNADFYAAYVRDPDGNKLAAVCRGFVASQ